MLTKGPRNAILSFYHLRPVPRELDGRTLEAQRRDEVPFVSLWLDDQKPGMYTKAAELKRRGFNSKVATLAWLEHRKAVS